jgi:hypothetical protein
MVRGLSDGVNVRKVVTFSSPPIPKDQLDKLISAVIQANEETNYMVWEINETLWDSNHFSMSPRNF